jgi:hypothetical protein
MLRIHVAVWLTVLALGVSAVTRASPPRDGETARVASLTPAPEVGAAEPVLEPGDLVLGNTRSSQSRAIQAATRSPWSHVGIVEVARDGTYVVEAIGRVSRTPWAGFRRRAGGRVLVLRPRAVDPAARARAVAEAKRFLGRPYDPLFGWGDDRIYCSELVVKAYERGAGVALGKRQRVGDLHLAGLEPAICARWGRVPRDLVLVTPASIAEDPKLERVYEGP